MKRHVLLSTILVGCGSEPTQDALVVTVNKRPAVNGAKTLKVKLTNETSELIKDLDLGNKDFPVTFSVSTPGRVGDLGIEVTAIDDDGLVVGKGGSTTTVDMMSASVLVDTADFVINTEFAEDQQLANFSPAIGAQLAVLSNGTWIAVHSADCPTPCHVFARRFDPNGQPVSSTVAAGTVSFPVSTRLTTFWSTPTVAANATTTVAIWNHDIEPPPATGSGYSLDCRAFDQAGAAMTGQVSIAPDDLLNMAWVTPLSNGNFAVGWEGRIPGQTVDTIRSAVVTPMCTLVGALGQVSTQTAGLGPSYVSVASSGNTIMYVWLLENNVHARTANFMNMYSTADARIIAKTATEHVEHVRIAPLPGGNFAVFSRWANIMGATGPGRIEMVRTNNAGVPQGTPVVVTTRSGTDFQSSQGFGVAAAPDGSLFVVWHSCGAMNGDGDGCGVYGRLLSPAGMPVGSEIQLNTTTKMDQTGPSAVALPGTPQAFATAWTDRSTLPPDTAGASVRARIVYPDGTGSN